MVLVCVKWVKISPTVSVKEQTRIMEALTDNQRFGRFNIIPLPLFVAGHNDKGNRFWIPFFFSPMAGNELRSTWKTLIGLSSTYNKLILSKI